MTYTDFEAMVKAFFSKCDPDLADDVEVSYETDDKGNMTKYIAKAGDYDMNMTPSGLMVTINLNRRNHTFQAPVRALLEAG